MVQLLLPSVATLEKELKDIVSTTQDIAKLEAQILSIQDALDALPEVNLKEVQEQQAELTANLVVLQERIKRGTTLLGVWEQLDQVNEDEPAAQLEKALLQVYENRQVAEDNVVGHRNDIQMLKLQLEELIRLREELEELEQKRAEGDTLRQRQEVLTLLQPAFKDIKQKRIDVLMSMLGDILPHYTSLLFSEKNLRVEVDVEEDSLNPRIIRSGTDIPLHMVSGGEAKRLSVAFLLALRKVVAPSKKSNILILDEVDGDLDKIGEDRFVELVIPELRKECSSIFVVTHRDGIASRKFDQTWTVVKENDEARLIR